METLSLKLAGREERTRIVVGHGAVSTLPRELEELGTRRAFLLADGRLKRVRAALARSLQAAGWEVGHADIAVRESAKDLARVTPLYGKLLSHRMDRGSVLVAVGGGVVGDIAGFVAGTFLRGIRWVGVPTTLLAQVDSSVGGKTGVNLPQGKNLVGVFHHPSLVVCDTQVLGSLSARDRVSGFGEMVKYGLALDSKYFHFLRDRAKEILKLDPKILPGAIAGSLRHKIAVVASDEREQTGARRRLNFGHTLGHALEGVTGYRRFRHGEAVIWGMRWAVALSAVRGHLPPETADEADGFLAALKVPPLPPRLDVRRLLPYLRRDKKATDGRVAFVLLRDIGLTAVDSDVEESDLKVAHSFLEKR